VGVGATMAKRGKGGDSPVGGDGGVGEKGLELEVNVIPGTPMPEDGGFGDVVAGEERVGLIHRRLKSDAGVSTKFLSISSSYSTATRASSGSSGWWDRISILHTLSSSSSLTHFSHVHSPPPPSTLSLS